MSKEHQEIEHLREEMREMKVTERKNQRAILFEKTRFALGECSANEVFTTQNVIDFGKELKKKPLSVKNYRQLQCALLQSDDNINAFLSVDHVIHSLVRDLSGNNPQIQLIAANCCCNIALGNAKACLAVAKNCIPYLVTELDSMSYLLVEACAWTIGNLIIGNPKIMEILIAQDCVKHLIKLINHSDCAVRSAAIYSAIRCLFVGHRMIPVNEIIDLAKEIKKSSKSIEEFEDLWILGFLSSHIECLEHLVHYAPNAVELLNNKLCDKNHNVVEITALIRLLGNLVNEPSGQVAALLLNNSSFTIESLLAGLLMHSYVHVRKETLWLIGNIYNHSKCRNEIMAVLPNLANLTCAISSVKATLN